MGSKRDIIANVLDRTLQDGSLFRETIQQIAGCERHVPANPSALCNKFLNRDRRDHLPWKLIMRDFDNCGVLLGFPKNLLNFANLLIAAALENAASQVQLHKPQDLIRVERSDSFLHLQDLELNGFEMPFQKRRIVRIQQENLAIGNASARGEPLCSKALGFAGDRIKVVTTNG